VRDRFGNTISVESESVEEEGEVIGIKEVEGLSRESTGVENRGGGGGDDDEYGEEEEDDRNVEYIDDSGMPDLCCSPLETAKVVPTCTLCSTVSATVDVRV
jgi:hypothetical protein